MKNIYSLLLSFALLLSSAYEAKAMDIKYLTINDNIRFIVEIAKENDELKKGLMFRSSLSDEKGMLFDFKVPQKVSMWMKNTYIPLDMLFINENKQIVFIAKNTIPQSLELITFEKPVLYVLEINAGLVDKLGIKIGDKINIKE